MSMINKIKVVLADDHSVVRKGIRLMIDNDKDLQIMGEASDGTQALSMIKMHQPHVLVADISMPGLSGIELTALINKEHPDTKVLILSTHNDEEYISRSFEAGALGYLPKDSNEPQIIAAIKSVSKGDVYYTPEVSNILTQSLIKKKRTLGENHELTEREREILKLIVEGLSNKEIGDQLFISVRTVDTHRRNIMEKLEARNTADLVRKALEEKLVKL